MDPQLRDRLVPAIVQAFGTPQALVTWVAVRVPDENVHNIINVAGLFNAQALDLLDWAYAQGRDQEVLQLLVDHPPVGNRLLPTLIHRLTNGDVKARGATIPPIPPHQDWFVTQRPFVNRTHLRSLLETLGMAGPGPDSILVIEGPKMSGKTHSVRFAKQCAAPGRTFSVDVADWNSTPMDAGDLAQAIYPPATVPEYDRTKEDAAVPRLMTWLMGRLNDGQPTWILLDHCSRPNLTQGASALLTLFASKVEGGDLPQVRLIIADIDWKNLPKGLRGLSRTDAADLPGPDDIKHWCESLATHLGKSYKSTDIEGYVASVFAGFPGAPTRESLIDVLEIRLSNVYKQIQAL